MWSYEQIQQHLEVAQELGRIKDEAFDLIQNGKDVSEYKVSRFILEKFKERKLVTDWDEPYVSFGKNTANVHHPPGRNSKKLENEAPVMIDIWARLKIPKAPFADMTWVAYYGNEIPDEFVNIFNTVKKARDGCIKFIKSKTKKGIIPLGNEIEATSDKYLNGAGYEEYVEHMVGHPIGTCSPHGNRKYIYERNPDPIHTNLGYTIEPAIYMPEKYGVRSEIDFYINDKLETIVTTEVQKEMVML